MSSEQVNHAVGDIVIRRTDDDRGVITGIVYRENSVEYLVRWEGSDDEQFIYDCEIKKDAVSV